MPKWMDQKLLRSQMEMMNVCFQLLHDGFSADGTSGWNPCPNEVNSQFVTDFTVPNICGGTLFSLFLAPLLDPFHLGREIVYHIFRAGKLYKCDDSHTIINSIYWLINVWGFLPMQASLVFWVCKQHFFNLF